MCWLVPFCSRALPWAGDKRLSHSLLLTRTSKTLGLLALMQGTGCRDRYCFRPSVLQPYPSKKSLWWLQTLLHPKCRQSPVHPVAAPASTTGFVFRCHLDPHHPRNPKEMHLGRVHLPTRLLAQGSPSTRTLGARPNKAPGNSTSSHKDPTTDSPTPKPLP